MGSRLKRLEEAIFLFSYLLIFWLFHVERLQIPALVLAGIAAALSALGPLRRFLSGSLFVLAMVTVMTLGSHFPVLASWPLDFFAVALAGWCICRKADQGAFQPRFCGAFGKLQWFSIIGIVVPAVFALTVYGHFYPEISSRFPVLPVPTWALPLALLGIAVLNGIREELVYRVLLQKYLQNGFPVGFAVVIQSAAFGLMHYYVGITNGPAGVILTFIFGLALGAQYFITRSVMVIWLTHSLVNLILFLMIA